jgi:nicotinate-nucleotide adenylyltransferase
MRVGVFGGSFDPIHLGHLVVAESARDALSLDHVLLIPARVPPHKPGRVLAGAEHRWRMVELACSGNDRLRPSRIEIDQDGVAYTVDTLRALRGAADAPAEMYLLLGADSLRDMYTWRDPSEIRRLAHLVVARRPGVHVHASDDVLVLVQPPLEISASDIRARVRAKRTIRYLVPDAVRAYIDEHGLYRE